MKLVHTAANLDNETAETLAGRTFLIEHLDRPAGSKRLTLLTPAESGAHMLALILASEKRAKGTASIAEVMS